MQHAFQQPAQQQLVQKSPSRPSKRLLSHPSTIMANCQVGSTLYQFPVSPSTLIQSVFLYFLNVVLQRPITPRDKKEYCLVLLGDRYDVDDVVLPLDQTLEEFSLTESFDVESRIRKMRMY